MINMLIEYARKNNLHVSLEELDKLEALEAMITLTNMGSYFVGSILGIIHDEYIRYDIKPEKDHFRVLRVVRGKCERTTKEDLISALEFCIKGEKIS